MLRPTFRSEATYYGGRYAYRQESQLSLTFKLVGLAMVNIRAQDISAVRLLLLKLIQYRVD